MLDDRIIEREILLRRLLSRTTLFQIGKTLDIPYFREHKSKWDIDEQKAAFEIAFIINDEQLKSILHSNKQRGWEVFRGQYYTVDQGEFRPEGSWKEIQAALAKTTGKECRTSPLISKVQDTRGGARSCRAPRGRPARPRA